MLQIFAGTLHQAVNLGLDDGLGQIEFRLGHQGIERGLLVASHQTGFDFARQVFFDVVTQGLDGGTGHPQRLGQIVVDFGQVRTLDLFDRDQEIGCFAGHFAAMVVGGECGGESFAFADF